MNDKLTDQVWKEGLKKWEPGNDYRGACAFCEIYADKKNAPSYTCIKNGCPLATPETGVRQSICCGETWWAWRIGDPDHKDTCALAVHDFIASKYIEWLENNKEVKKPEKTLLERLVDMAGKEWNVYTDQKIIFFAGNIDLDFIAILGRNDEADFILTSKRLSERIAYKGNAHVCGLNIAKRDTK